MEIRKFKPDALVAENGVHSQRLLPWPALQAPFEGSWCVIRPGTSSTPHAHHESEIFIALKGAAVITVDGESTAFEIGDVVKVAPGQKHTITNSSSEDFHMYSIWWDADMSTQYLASGAALPNAAQLSGK